MNSQKLYRSTTNKVFAGVCGGLAEYFDVDPIVIRVLFVLMVLFGGSGILLYIAAVIIVPKKPYFIAETAEQPPVSVSPRTGAARNWFGMALVFIGALLLLANLDVFHFFSFFEDTFEFILPVLLIVLGMAIIYYHQTRTDQNGADAKRDEGSPAGSEPGRSAYRQFKRSSADRKIFGVCGGLANYFGIDSSLIRMLYVVLCLASFGAGIVLYLLIAVIVPYDYHFTAQVS